MTKLTIGRVGLDFDLDGVTRWDHDGDQLSITVEVYSSLDQALAVRQQILGYVDSPDQLFVPVTWSDESQADGYYRVESASVTPDTFGRDVFTLDVTLRRVQGYAMPAIQTTYLFHERVNVHDVSPVAYLGQPSATRWGYAFEPEDGTYSNQPTSHIVSCSEGTVDTITASITGGAGPDAGELALWIRNIDPADYYVGAARIEVGGYPIEGRQVPSDWENNWRLTNGTSELTMDASGISGDDAIFQMRGWNGFSWTDPIPVTLRGDNVSTSRVPFSAPKSLTILKNTAEEVIIRFALIPGGGKDWPVFLDITCRRGVRTFTCRLRRASGTGNAYPAISVPNHLTEWGWRRSGAWVSAGTIVETNYLWNVRALFDGTYWDRFASTGTATGRITGVSVGSTGITTAFRCTASAAHATATFGVGHGQVGTSSTPNTVAASTQYTFSVWVRCSVTRSVNLRVQWRNSSDATIGTLDAGDTAVTANVWKQITVTGTSPALTTRASVHVRGNTAGAAWTAGDTLDMTGLQCEAGATVNPFWDGEDSASDDLIYVYANQNAPNCASLKFDRSSDPTYWVTSPIATVPDTDGWEPDPVVDSDPQSWDFGMGVLSTGIGGDQGRYLREVQGYYMTITQSDDVVAV